jgi:hypothetical protein
MVMLDTGYTWNFTVASNTSEFPDTMPPEVAFVGGMFSYTEVDAVSPLHSGAHGKYNLTVYLYFTEQITAFNVTYFSIHDCGQYYDCESPLDNAPVWSHVFVNDRPQQGNAWENGLLQISARVPHGNRRYRLTVPPIRGRC